MIATARLIGDHEISVMGVNFRARLPRGVSD
jgi:hypothetical protein